MRRYTAVLALAALAAALTGVTACAPSSHTSRGTEATNGSATKQGDGTLRTDLAPIAERYPQLASSESVQWMGGRTGTSDLGPSTYWVDVVAVIPQSEVDILQAIGGLDAVQPPALVPGMQAKLPAGPFEGGEALDDLFSSGGRSASVALDPGTRTLVLSGLFE